MQSELEPSTQTPMARVARFHPDNTWLPLLSEPNPPFTWVKLVQYQKHTLMDSVSTLKVKMDLEATSTSTRTACTATRMSSPKLQARIFSMPWAPLTDSVQATAPTHTTPSCVQDSLLRSLIRIDRPSKRQATGFRPRRRSSCMTRLSKWRFWTTSFAMKASSSRLKSRSLRMNWIERRKQ